MEGRIYIYIYVIILRGGDGGEEEQVVFSYEFWIVSKGKPFGREREREGFSSRSRPGY